MVVLAGVGHAETQGHHVEETGLRQRNAEAGEVGADTEVEFIDAGLEGIAFEQRRIAAAIVIGFC